MSEENKERKRSPLIPVPLVRDKHGSLVHAPERSEVEVPFEIYEDYCSQCMNREKTLTPREEYVKQLSKFIDERKPVKIICTGVNRCSHLRKLLDEWKQKRGYV